DGIRDKLVTGVQTCALPISVINCLGVRSGSNVQSALMVMKIAAIVMLVVLGWRAIAPHESRALHRESHENFLAAMVPVLFAYGEIGRASCRESVLSAVV